MHSIHSNRFILEHLFWNGR